MRETGEIVYALMLVLVGVCLGWGMHSELSVTSIPKNQERVIDAG